MSRIKASALSAFQLIRDFRYHSWHKSTAFQILRSVEGSKGKIARRDRRLCDEYAVEVFGHRRYAPWLYVYTAVSGGFKEGWIPDNYYGAVVVPKLKGVYGRLSRLKPLNYTFFQSDCFPDLLSYTNGMFIDVNGRIVPPRSVRDILFAETDRVVFKLDNSHQGRGIHIFECESFDLTQITKLGNGLFQAFVRQHEEFDQFVRSAVATIRLTTVIKENGDVSLRACYLRLGIEGESHVQSRTAIKVPVDPQTGVLSEVGFTPEWIEISAHPSSGTQFLGKAIPRFAECVHVVTTLHRKVPYVRCVGWDCIVDVNERVRVLEWNGGHNGIKFTEATQGPCFADLGWESLWRF